MAKLPPSSIMHGASGKIGGIVFRQVAGQTIVQAANESLVKRSKLQQRFNDKMREAAAHAKAALRDPAVKAHYVRKMKRLNVSSPYTAACTDFLRHGRIDKVDTAKYDKGVIIVKAFKPDLGFEELVVKVSAQDGKLVTAARATLKEQGHWHFKSPVPLPPLQEATITIEAKDKTGNITLAIQEPHKAIVTRHNWCGASHLASTIIR